MPIQWEDINAVINEVDFEYPVEVQPIPILAYGTQAPPVNPYDLLILIPAVTFITAFAKSFGSKLGDHAAQSVGKSFSAWVNRLHKAKGETIDVPRPIRGKIIVYDKKKELRIKLSPNLPTKAYDQLHDSIARWPDGIPGKSKYLVYNLNAGWIRSDQWPPES